MEQYKYERQRDSYQMDMLRNIVSMFAGKNSKLPPRYIELAYPAKAAAPQSENINGEDILNELMTAW